MFSGRTCLTFCTPIVTATSRKVDIIERLPFLAETPEDCQLSANQDLYLLDRESRKLQRLDIPARKTYDIGPWKAGTVMAISAQPSGGLYVLLKGAPSSLLVSLDRNGQLLDQRAIESDLIGPASFSMASESRIFIADRMSHTLLEIRPESVHRWSGRVSYREAQVFMPILDEQKREEFLEAGLFEYPSWVACKDDALLIVDRDKILYRRASSLFVWPQPQPFLFGHPVFVDNAVFLLGENSTILRISLTDLATEVYQMPFHANALAIFPPGRLTVLHMGLLVTLAMPA